LLNEGPGPLTNITVHFTVTPKGLEELSSAWKTDAETTVLGNRDVLIFKYPSLAPQEAPITVVPFIVRSGTVPDYGHELGEVSVDITYDQGAWIQQHVKIVAINEPNLSAAIGEKELTPRLKQLTHRLALPTAPFTLGGRKAALSAFLNFPFLTISWIARDIALKPTTTNIAVDQSVLNREEPQIFSYELGLGFNRRGRIQFLILVFSVAAAALFVYAFLTRLARYLGYTP
jgi:hypothetical protein